MLEPIAIGAATFAAIYGAGSWLLDLIERNRPRRPAITDYRGPIVNRHGREIR